ncbi:MAG: sigma-70 family RNA polymerase sigma factor [Myxococcota bacterium]
MARVARDDRAAYEALYARWREPVFRFLLRRTGSRAAAEEAHQEAWLRVYRFRARFDPRRAFKGWLFTIAANCGRDAWRPEPELFALPLAPGDPHDLRDKLLSALGVLPDDDRKLLLLAVEGFTGPEIAQMTNLGAGAVRMRLTRARQQVRGPSGGPMSWPRDVDALIRDLAGPSAPTAAPAWPAPRRWPVVVTALALAAVLLAVWARPAATPTARGVVGAAVALDLRMVVERGGIAVRVAAGEPLRVGERVLFRVAAEAPTDATLWVVGPRGRERVADVALDAVPATWAARTAWWGTASTAPGGTPSSSRRAARSARRPRWRCGHDPPGARAHLALRAVRRREPEAATPAGSRPAWRRRPAWSAPTRRGGWRWWSASTPTTTPTCPTCPSPPGRARPRRRPGGPRGRRLRRRLGRRGRGRPRRVLAGVRGAGRHRPARRHGARLRREPRHARPRPRRRRALPARLRRPARRRAARSSGSTRWPTP